MPFRGSPQARAMVYEFVLFILQNNIVQVEGQYYRQIQGGAMGTNCLPQVAQLYLAVKWEGPIRRRLGDAFPALYKRFIDDGFVVFNGTRAELLEFVHACRMSCLTYASLTASARCRWSSWTWLCTSQVLQGLMGRPCECARTRSHSTGTCTSLGTASTTQACLEASFMLSSSGMSSPTVMLCGMTAWSQVHSPVA